MDLIGLENLILTATPFCSANSAGQPQILKLCRHPVWYVPVLFCMPLQQHAQGCMHLQEFALRLPVAVEQGFVRTSFVPLPYLLRITVCKMRTGYEAGTNRLQPIHAAVMAVLTRF